MLSLTQLASTAAHVALPHARSYGVQARSVAGITSWPAQGLPLTVCRRAKARSHTVSTVCASRTVHAGASKFDGEVRFQAKFRCLFRCVRPGAVVPKTPEDLVQVKVAFIGAGGINFGTPEGPWNHSARLQLLPDVTFSAIVDPNQKLAQERIDTLQKGTIGVQV